MDHLWTPWRYAYVTQEDTREPTTGGRARPSSQHGPETTTASFAT